MLHRFGPTITVARSDFFAHFCIATFVSTARLCPTQSFMYRGSLRLCFLVHSLAVQRKCSVLSFSLPSTLKFSVRSGILGAGQLYVRGRQRSTNSVKAQTLTREPLAKLLIYFSPHRVSLAKTESSLDCRNGAVYSCQRWHVPPRKTRGCQKGGSNNSPPWPSIEEDLLKDRRPKHTTRALHRPSMTIEFLISFEPQRLLAVAFKGPSFEPLNVSRACPVSEVGS